VAKKFKPYKTLSSTVFKHTPWNTFRHNIFRYPDGTVGHYYYVDSQGSVYVVPILPNGKILLIRQYHYLFQSQESYEFPGGGSKTGKSAKTSARDELQEETGYSARRIERLGTYCPIQGVSNELCNVFLAYGLLKGKARPEETEQIVSIQRKPEEIDAMIQRNKIWDGQAIVAWTLAREKVKRIISKKQYV
jgi:ADP-ribose pyrophosphatase